MWFRLLRVFVKCVIVVMNHPHYCQYLFIFGSYRKMTQWIQPNWYNTLVRMYHYEQLLLNIVFLCYIFSWGAYLSSIWRSVIQIIYSSKKLTDIDLRYWNIWTCLILWVGLLVQLRTGFLYQHFHKSFIKLIISSMEKSLRHTLFPEI